MKFRHIPYIWNHIKNARSYLNKEITTKGYPKVLGLEPTNACTMRCKMCPRQFMKREIGFMDMNLFKSIIDQTKGLTSIISLELFGDPLLHPKIHEMTAYMHKKGMISQLSTNPTALTDKAIERILNSKLDILLLSLDGTDEQTYKENRGGAADYDLAVKNIKKFLKLRKGNKPHVDIRMIDLPNLDFKLFKKQWAGSSVDQISLGPFHTFGGSVEGESSIHCNDICFKPWLGVHIMWDGRVVPCCFDYDGEVILGDLKKQSLKEIWNSSTIQDFRKECISGKFTNPMCAKCDEKKSYESVKKHIINYNYQRHQHKGIVKRLRKAYKHLR